MKLACCIGFLVFYVYAHVSASHAASSGSWAVEVCWAAHHAGNSTWICSIYDSGTSWDLPRLSKCSWHLVPLSYQTSPLPYFHQKFPEGKSFPPYVFIALYEGIIRHKAPCQSMRLKSRHVPSVGKAALPAPSYCSDCCVERNRRAQALLVSAFPGVLAGFCMTLFSPLLGRASMYSLGAGNKWKRRCRLNWDKWDGIKKFPPKHREDMYL